METPDECNDNSTSCSTAPSAEQLPAGPAIVNERDIIERLSGLTAAESPDLLRGIGDDCAVIRKNNDCSWLVTMDTLVESVHFDLRWHPPGKLGRKAVAVNVSDIAAMGGTPVFVFLSLGLPAGFADKWLEEFGLGLSDACRSYGCVLAGGDTVRSAAGVVVTLTVIGEVGSGSTVLRSGAAIGESIWVSGSLGRAAAGLELCRSDLTGDDSFRELIDAHLDPQPRLELGRLLAQRQLAGAMLDLSDGLATDLGHLCQQSRVGALIEPSLLPAAPNLQTAAALLDRDPLQWMLAGGEDYELVFTSSQEKSSAVEDISRETGIPITRIGMIDGREGVRMRRILSDEKTDTEVDITFSGFDHFAE